ncbi:HNH endonuclease [Hwangdonia lutea]|uniref:HNH endonuclease n=1 Tax=Hwangdonia lutea TaxID=3075823 RepID=A0AA97HQP7_9FLAO|nr:HNH endonuclease [Hwangdonia sp. SCSIO 19198]WOD43170.1 HNH endonuclease [Hwangdonia sp. SCSIO 19198]
MFSYKDIQWVRNVKREGGDNWAYFDEDNDEMILHWSSAFTNIPTPAMTPKKGDVVVLFQKMNTSKQFHFTHLLSPVDDIELDCIDKNPKHRWGRKMKILAKTQKVLRPDSLGLGRVNQGHTYPIEYLNLDTSKENIQKIIWNAFKPFFREGVFKRYVLELSDSLIDENLDNVESEEGKWNYAMHRFRERDRGLVQKKKASVIKPTCECCTFDFSNTYPDLGDGFIECHHRIPINQGERITKLEDLALVCANCHRMLHRKNNQNEYYTVDELKQIIINE